MKILFLGDYSNLHATLALQLRRLGHEVTVVSDRCRRMGTDCDIYLMRNPGKLGTMKYLWDVMSLMPQLKGYDVVQLINPHFFTLKPSRLRMCFDELKRTNGSVHLTLAGPDHNYVKVCTTTPTFQYSEYRIGTEPSPFTLAQPQNEAGWMRNDVARYTDYLYKNIDGAVSVLYEYHLAAAQVIPDKLTYGGIPIPLEDYDWRLPDTRDGINIFVGIKSEMSDIKGESRMLDIARKAIDLADNRAKLVHVKDMPLTDYLAAMQKAHIVLDQMYAQSPATNALGAMAMGKVAASGAQPGFYDFIGEEELRPVFSLSPIDNTAPERLAELISDTQSLGSMACEGREFVERHNDARKVVLRYLDHWQKTFDSK